MSTKNLSEQILAVVQSEGYTPQGLEQLAKVMGIGQAEQGDFHDACKALMKSGRVALGTGQAVMLSAPPGKVTGTFRGNKRGFGFVVPDTPNAHGDLYVSAGATGGAMTGDVVTVSVKKRGKRQGQMLYEGKVTAILKRAQSRFVGELRHEFSKWLVLPDGNTLHTPIVVDDPGAKRAQSGDQVVVEILQYPDGDRHARGVIVKVLGQRGQPGVDLKSIIEQYQLPADFDKRVLDEAREVIAGYDPAEALTTREDLRSLTIITIDPTDAKDFDDAISITTTDDGKLELGIHIADVAHFVREGGALDHEARERSNSVYLPGMVVPMLPEVLSNGVCSLQERQPRLTKSAFITYDRFGRVKKTRFANTVIRSTKRLTYEQADRILRGKTGRMSAKVVALLKEMETLARRIHRRRLREGALELDLPDVDLVFDERGVAVDARPADQSFPHKIIEMFMVESNEAVARLLSSLNVGFLRRTHGEPSEIGDETLRRFLRMLGHELPDGADRFDVQRLLDRARGKPEAFAVNLAVLRTFQRAEYSPMAIGHFALASSNYCHFTSPIRRYPDLTIHRLLDHHLTGNLRTRGAKRTVPSQRALETLGKLCSTNERHAEAAERELKLVYVLRMLEKHVGEQFDGIVTGVANVGVFVQLTRYLVDGLLSFNRLPDDWWEIDPSRGAVVGQRSGRRITIGDRLKVTIAGINLPLRQLDLALAQPLPPRGKGTTRADGATPRENRAARADGRSRGAGKPKTKAKATKSRRGRRSKPKRRSTPRGRR